MPLIIPEVWRNKVNKEIITVGYIYIYVFIYHYTKIGLICLVS